MARQDRTTSLDTFKSSSAVTILLLSLKVGGVGLNLTEASRVYIMEPYWNPAIEQQAIDRIHRLGQKKQVYCIRYLINNSVEDRLVEMQKRKMELVRMTFNEEETNSGEEDVGAVQSGGSKGKKRIVVGNSEQERIQQQQERINDLNMLLGSGI
ncbi:hypothetical protein HK098_005603 [Nowakowskiella sp. JEL0407]|nr:hypothetical protein HK098_005603 [Nowakowskiella sp. JEL0407]